MDYDAFEREVAALKARLAERDAKIEALEDRASQVAALFEEIKPSVDEQKSPGVFARLQLLLGKASSE